MKLKRMIAVLMIVIFTLSSGTVSIEASKNSGQVKLLSINNKRKCIKVKVKIINNSKKYLSFGEKFSLYKETGSGKWKKIKCNDKFVIPDIEYILFAGKNMKKTFYINKEAFKENIEVNKRYMIKFRISGKKKTIKFNL